jgi:hypothetical protein
MYTWFITIEFHLKEWNIKIELKIVIIYIYLWWDKDVKINIAKILWNENKPIYYKH